MSVISPFHRAVRRPSVALMMVAVCGLPVSASAADLSEALPRSPGATALKVRAKGVWGHANMKGNDKLLPQDLEEKFRQIAYVTKIEPYLLAMYPMDGMDFGMTIGMVPGDTERLESHGETAHMQLVAGRDFSIQDRGQDVALIGQRFAAWAGISPQAVGRAMVTIDPNRSSHIIYGIHRAAQPLRVVGIFKSDYAFGDMQVLMPIDTFRRIYGIDTGFTWLYVNVDSPTHLAGVQQQIKTIAGDQVEVSGPRTGQLFASVPPPATNRLAEAGGLAVLAIAILGLMAGLVSWRRNRTDQ